MGWTHGQRAAFLRHVRPYWDVHRHRAVPSIGARIDHLISTGTLRVLSGRTMGWTPTRTGIAASILPRGSASPVSIEAARVVNCTGPAQAIAHTNDPLVRALLDRGALSPDPLCIGARCDADGRILDRAGRANPRIWMLGPWRCAEVWESVAVPELRVQAADVAASLMATARSDPGITPSLA
jgi:uncharacterized NAD(P)/FAD-binding protein YdhS